MEHLAPRVKETTTTTGTGDITTAGAVTGFQTLNTAFGTNKWIYYVLVDANGTAWEEGRGYLSASTTFKRTRVYRSTNSNNAINLSAGTHTIFCDANMFFFDNLYGRILALSKNAPMP